MKFIARSFFTLGLILLVTLATYAQPVTSPTGIDETYRTALELFQTRKFSSAYHEFNKIIKQSEPSSGMFAEATYYKAVCALEMGNRNGKEELEDFIDKYPNSPQISMAHFRLANVEFANKRYRQAMRDYEKVDAYLLPRAESDEYKFKLGYCYLDNGENEKAKTYFYDLKNKRGKFSRAAAYYWAHINYLEGNYETALLEFQKLKDDPQYSGIVPFYTAQIYFMQKKYDEVIKMAPPLLKAASPERKIDISKIIGDSWFQKDQYSKALPYLNDYMKNTEKPTTDDYYIIGMCQYETGDYKQAIANIERATRDKDAVAQNAYYHLAGAYLKDGQKQKAMMAFSNASEMSFDPKIKEDALFQYAKITYELDYSPFNEAIKAFDKYITLYPNSERNDVAYDYLVKVFMTTRNYKDALASLDKIKVKSPAIKKAYQRVAYYRALEFFRDTKLKQAIELFNKSLQYSQYNDELKALSYYWKGEAEYRLNDKEAAILDYRRFQTTAGSYRMKKEYALSNYNIGYAYFDQEKYGQAASWFRKFLTFPHDKDPKQVADAYNRLGDCAYVQRNFQDAIAQYQKAYHMNTYDADYALFQTAFCYGLLHKQQQKINDLNKLQVQFPDSRYRDDAIFETGRAWERAHNDDNAKKSFKNLLVNYPNSPYQPKALLQLGLISFNENDYNNSLSYYKQVVEKYANTPEAKAALTGIRNNYVEMNQVEDYFTYAQSLGKTATPSQSEQDSLLYTSAENLYMKQSPKAMDALTSYLSRFPDGAFAINAHFYRGELYYNQQNLQQAAVDYDYVLSRGDNIFSEPALLKASEIAYREKDYNKALALYTRLEKQSNNSKDNLTALTGILRSNYELKNYQAVTEAGWQIRNTEKVPEEISREAEYKAAKTYLTLNEPTKAYTLFRKLSKDTKTAEGAEAKYQVCKYYYDHNQLKAAENEVMSFIDKNTPHQYWLAKSFILLAHVYEKEGDLFQATHTLQSIIDNYGEPDDGIIKESELYLKDLEAKQKAQSAAQSQQDSVATSSTDSIRSNQ
ncbi:tetratricopeptide repeat protein [Prolixibacter sp. NT017]|uniref:tetratricopeptide repeat protein n=1 Tax=Prolixibacter sp. NT017 TaxID=2652390 RepID=UPI0012706A7C|nr:tetratricopeptide repeat protein [Prolixibacter sp. NT017]GET23756.1 hypothetical protein NT017_00850 [Prolixibacter sp. NT017]